MPQRSGSRTAPGRGRRPGPRRSGRWSPADSSRTPSTSPPCETTDCARAIERALPWPLIPATYTRRNSARVAGAASHVEQRVGHRRQEQVALGERASSRCRASVRRDQVGAPVQRRLRHAEVEVGAERLGDEGAELVGQRHAGGRPDQAVEQVAVADHVVAGRRARAPTTAPARPASARTPRGRAGRRRSSGSVQPGVARRVRRAGAGPARRRGGTPASTTRPARRGRARRGRRAPARSGRPSVLVTDQVITIVSSAHGSPGRASTAPEVGDQLAVVDHRDRAPASVPSARLPASRSRSGSNEGRAGPGDGHGLHNRNTF